MRFLGHKFLIITSAFTCLIFGLLFFSQPANAASVTNLGITNGGDINIPAHSADTIVFCAFAPDSNSGFYHSAVSQFRLNGPGLGIISMNREVIDNWYQYFYTINPSPGTYTIQKYSSYDWRDIYWSSNVTDGNQVVSCIMIDGIDIANPIKQYQFMGYDNGSGTKDFVNGTIGNIVMLSAQNFSTSDLTLTSNLNDLLPDKRFAANDWHNNLYSWATITNTTTTYSVSGLGGVNTQYSAVEFNTVPATNDYILYYGEDPYYSVSLSDGMKYVYDICDSYNISHDYILQFEVDSEVVSSSYLGTGSGNGVCSGAYTYFHDIINIFSTSGTSTLSIYDITENETPTLVVSSNEFQSVISPPSTPPSKNYIMSKYENYSIPYSSTATTTDVLFIYDVCGIESFSTSTPICLTGSDFHCFQPTSCFGNDGVITVPLPPKGNTSVKTFVLMESDSSPNSYYLSDSWFSIRWTSLGVPFEPDLCASSSSWFDEKFCQVSNYFFKPLFDSTFDKFMTVFPLVFIKEVSNSWERSANLKLPPSLSWLNFLDSEGNMYISLPSHFGENARLLVFGNDIFRSRENISSWFSDFRDLTKFIFWFAFIWALVSLSKKVINNFNEK